MIRAKYEQGVLDALAHLKLSNLQQGAAGYSPALAGQAATGTAATTTMQPPAPASSAIAAHAAKSKVLG